MSFTGSGGSNPPNSAPTPAPLNIAAVAGSPFTLTSGWQKVATNTAATKALILGAGGNASAYDIEWTVTAAGAGTPSDTKGNGIGLAENFAAGIPIGDIYARSASGQSLVVRQA
jgi:hypothetical protein